MNVRNLTDESIWCFTRDISKVSYWLSATPYRPDDMIYLSHVLWKRNLYTFLYLENMLYIRVNTNIGLSYRIFTRDGKIDWNALLHSQATHIDRNERIFHLFLRRKTRTFLILAEKNTSQYFLIDCRRRYTYNFSFW